MKVLVSGAAGNLGSRVARHLLERGHRLHLLVHNTLPEPALAANVNASLFSGDLGDPDSLRNACNGVECVVHLAGVLFAPGAARFLPRTNVEYLRNLLRAAQDAGAKRFVFISFPHVEGETTPEHPATDRLEAESDVIHFRTRLEAERVLLRTCEGTATAPVILRTGAVYGKGVKLIEATRWLLRHRMMAVWRQPTWVHLVALPDFLAAVAAGVELPNVRGIYNVCDEQPMTLQEFVDTLAGHWGYARPWRMPVWSFQAAAAACETFAAVFRTAAPLTRDIVRAAMTSAVADPARARRELPALQYPTLRDGLGLL